MFEDIAWHRNTTFLNQCFYFFPCSDCVNEMQDKECEKYVLDCKVEERYNNVYHRHIWEYCSKTCNRKCMQIHYTFNDWTRTNQLR